MSSIKRLYFHNRRKYSRLGLLNYYSNLVDKLFTKPYGLTLKKYPSPKIPTLLVFTSSTILSAKICFVCVSPWFTNTIFKFLNCLRNAIISSALPCAEYSEVYSTLAFFLQRFLQPAQVLQLSLF